MDPVVAQPSGRDLLSPEAQHAFRVGSNIVTILMVIASLAGLALGTLAVTTATMGVWLVCAGCLFAVLARIAQAGYQHKQIIALLENARRP